MSGFVDPSLGSRFQGGLWNPNSFINRRSLTEPLRRLSWILVTYRECDCPLGCLVLFVSTKLRYFQTEKYRMHSLVPPLLLLPSGYHFPLEAHPLVILSVWMCVVNLQSLSDNITYSNFYKTFWDHHGFTGSFKNRDLMCPLLCFPQWSHCRTVMTSQPGYWCCPGYWHRSLLSAQRSLLCPFEDTYSSSLLPPPP